MCSKCKLFPETWSYIVETWILYCFWGILPFSSQPYSMWQRYTSKHKWYLCVSSLLLFSWFVSIQILSQTHMLESRIQTLVHPVTNLQESQAKSCIFECECLWMLTEKGWVWRGPSTAVLSSPPCSEQGQLKHVAQAHVPWGLQLCPRT